MYERIQTQYMKQKEVFKHTFLSIFDNIYLVLYLPPEYRELFVFASITAVMCIVTVV